MLVSAASRKIHGSMPLDLNLPLTGTRAPLDVQSLRGSVNGQVVDAPLDAGQVNRPDQCQRRLAR